MKNRNLFAGIILFASAVTFQACNDNLPGVEDSFTIGEKSGGIVAAYGDSCTYSGILSETDIAGLIEMREEEKMAGDVYSTFFEEYSLDIFKNISESEAIHTNAVLSLINGYGLEDPATGIFGEFTNPLFNELFAQLTEKGSVSLTEALKTGAFVEEYDINDLMLLLEETENADIMKVYGNLLKGSESHLRAFVKVLEQYGESYTPSVIDETLYQEILAGNSHGNGSGNSNQYEKGKGSGSGTGNGTQANGANGNQGNGANGNGKK